MYRVIKLTRNAMDLRSPDTYARARPYTRDYANIHPLHHSCNVSFSRRFPSRDYPHGWSASDFIIVAVHETNISHALSLTGGRAKQKLIIGITKFFLGTYSQLNFYFNNYFIFFEERI